MQRDIGNEIIVAIVVVGVLAFALTSAIILSLSSGAAVSGAPATAQAVVPTTEAAATLPPASATPAAERATDTPEATAAVTATVAASRTPAPPTKAPSATPTDEPQPSATFTDRLQPSVTPTDKPRPSATPTDKPRPSATPTDRPPSATATDKPRPSATPAATETPVPTATPRPSQTPVPTATNTAAPTATLRPSATPAPTQTASPPPSSTPTPTETPTDPAGAVSGTRVFCIAPFGWRLYEVQAGETLASIARATGSVAFDLQVANCLGSATAVAPGDVIYVPRLPGEPVQTAVPGQATTDSALVGGLQAVGCGSPNAQITSPAAGARAAGQVAVTGTAAGAGFGYYLLEVRSEYVTVYTQYLHSAVPVNAGSLGVINSDVFPPGIYWIRLSVFDQGGGINNARCAVPVYFD